MTFLIDHFWKILFLLGVTVGGWFAYDRYERGNEWTRVTEGFRSAYDEIQTQPEASDEDSYGKYWRLLALLKEFQINAKLEHITPVPPEGVKADDSATTATHTKWLLDAVMASGSGSKRKGDVEAQLTLVANLQLCEELGVFLSDKNMTQMLAGRAPVIQEGPFEGDTLAVTQRIPIFAARQIARHPANFTLIPEPALGIVSQDVDAKVRELAQRFRGADILNAESMQQITQMYEAKRR